MANYIQIIRIQSILTIGLHLVIWKIKFLPLVNITTVVPKTIKWNYLILAQIRGRRKLHFLTAHLREFIFGLYFGTHTFSISRYGVISRKSSVLIIGGYCDGSYSSSIAKYTIDKWQRVGNLQNSRHADRAIANEDRIYVVGGYGTL